MHCFAGLSFQALVLEPNTRIVDSFITNYLTPLANSTAYRQNVPLVWWQDFYQTVHSCRMSSAEYPLTAYTQECYGNMAIDAFIMNNMYNR